MAKVFSLTTVSVIITNPTKGQITIGGAGKLLGSVMYGFNHDIFTMDDAPDGGYVANFNGSKSGYIDIVFKQTSSNIPELVDFMNWTRSNPTLAGSELKIVDTLGNIAASASGVFPNKIPDNTVAETAGNRTFRFLAGEINSEETSV